LEPQRDVPDFWYDGDDLASYPLGENQSIVVPRGRDIIHQVRVFVAFGREPHTTIFDPHGQDPVG
jgi:hypothetical protein